MSSMGKKLFNRSKVGSKKKNQDSRDDLDMDHHLYDRKGSAGNVMMKSSKSNSLGSVTSEPSSAPLEQEDFMSLMHDVRNFSDALGKLKDVFQSYEEGFSEGDVRVSAHEKLGEVLSVLRSVLHKCKALHTTDVLTDAVVLISKIKGFHYEDAANNIPELHASIDQLALDFSISVSEYLMGDVDNYPQMGKTKSYDNLATADSDLGCSDEIDSKDTGEELDNVLLRLEYGMDVALSWAKAWSKYTKEILNYIEKRSSLECDFAKGLSKLATSVRQSITEDSCLPFQSIYCSALEHDQELASTQQTTCALIQTQKFLEPLTQQRHDHDKLRKALKDQWTRELRKMQDAVSNLRKARSLYMSRQQEYDKAKEAAQRAESESLSQSTGANKADKKKKLEEEAMHRAVEAETTYKGSVAEANNRQRELERTKAEILGRIRVMILQCDQTMKTATVTYFQLEQTVTVPLPVQYKTLYNSSKQYEPGSQYDEFVRRITVPLPNNNNNQEPFAFEPYAPDGKSFMERKQSTQSSGSGSSDVHFPDDSPDKFPRGLSPLKAWTQAVAQGAASDTDSVSGSSCKSAESSPSASPSQQRPVRLAGPSHDETEKEIPYVPPGVSVSGGSGKHDFRFQGVPLSRPAQTHVFRKLRTPSRCRECESYVYFHGAECEKCGLTSHRRCLETLHWDCGHDCTHKPLQRRMTTFGVDLNQHVQETHTDIPILVQKCCEEIDQRGLQAKGIYRLSGVKSRVEKLCQSFEIDEGNVDLSEHHPNVIANVLKLYLRQLPEPLLTYRLYPDLLALIKEDAQAEGTSEIKLVQRLNSMLADLPSSNFRTLAMLMHHLKRVTEHEEANQMSASNLGIVFGPTLLRPSDGAASLNSLMDTPHQTKIVELLITHVEYVFGPDEKPPEQKPPVTLEVPRPKETPVEVLSEASPAAKADPVQESVTDGKEPKDENAPSSPTEAKWYVTTTESLLDELAREEPRFIQPSEEFMVLPGSTGSTSAKSDKTDGAEKPEEKEKDTTPTTESQTPQETSGDAVTTSATTTWEATSDDDVPLPDDSNTSPLTSSTSPLAQTIAGAVLTSLTGTPALGPSFSACTNLGLGAAWYTGTDTPRRSLPILPIPAGSSPGLRRKLLLREVLHKVDRAEADGEQLQRRVPSLSKPNVYSPPIHRRVYRISGVKPASKVTESLDLATSVKPESSKGGGEVLSQKLSQSTFYAPNVIPSSQSAFYAPNVVTSGQTVSGATTTSSSTDSKVLVSSEEQRQPEFV